MDFHVGTTKPRSCRSGPPAPAARPSPPRYAGEGGRPLPGVTSILRDLGLGTDLSWVSAEKLAALAARGTRVHQFAARALRVGSPWITRRRDLCPGNEDTPYLNAFCRWQEASSAVSLGGGSRSRECPLSEVHAPAPSIREIEFIVGENGDRPWRGRLDLATRLPLDRAAIYDFKLRPSAASDGLQLAAYAAGLRMTIKPWVGAESVTRRRIVSLRADGTYRETRFDHRAAQDDLAWKAALARWWDLYRDDPMYATKPKED